MLKFKILLISLVALVYYGVTYCMLRRGICQYYADYYLLNERSFSLKEEKQFEVIPIKKVTDFFRQYRFNSKEGNVKMIGFVRFDENGVWTNGNTAKLSFRLEQVYSDVFIDFDVDPYINSRNREVIAEVYMDEHQIGIWNFEYGRKMPSTKFKLLRKNIPDDREINLTFKLSGMKSPQSLGFGKEQRKLGISFNSFEVLPKN